MVLLESTFVLLQGLLYAGMTEASFNRLGDEARMRRFLAMYCLLPVVWAVLLDELQNLLPSDHPDYIQPRNLTLKYLLVFAHWATTDRVYANLATQFQLSERNVQTWVWNYAKAIAALVQFKVSNAASNVYSIQ